MSSLPSLDGITVKTRRFCGGSLCSCFSRATEEMGSRTPAIEEPDTEAGESEVSLQDRRASGSCKQRCVQLGARACAWHTEEESSEHNGRSSKTWKDSSRALLSCLLLLTNAVAKAPGEGKGYFRLLKEGSQGGSSGRSLEQKPQGDATRRLLSYLSTAQAICWGWPCSRWAETSYVN